MSNQIQLHEHASYSYCAHSWRQQTNPSRKKIFHRVENVIKQLVHMSAVRSSRYEALGKFGEHLRIFCALQTSHVLHISMNACWWMNQLLIYHDPVNNYCNNNCIAEKNRSLIFYFRYCKLLPTQYQKIWSPLFYCFVTVFFYFQWEAQSPEKVCVDVTSMLVQKLVLQVQRCFKCSKICLYHLKLIS